jgi:uncharacterized protein
MSPFKPTQPDELGDDVSRRLTFRDREAVTHAFHTDFVRRPPTIGVIGVSGTGKSSAINAMFKTSLEISHTRACTREFRATGLALKALKGPVAGAPVRLVVVDAPGLGEDIRMDPIYVEHYHRWLPRCDVVLWVMAARSRAVSLDQQYLEQLGGFHDRIVFAINQVDIVHPMDWNTNLNLPSVDMERNIEDIAHCRMQKIGEVVGQAPDMVAFSASKGYNLETLFHRLISAAPPTRRFVFDLLKNFSYRDFVPAEARGLVEH